LPFVFEDTVVVPLLDSLPRDGPQPNANCDSAKEE
jgi:hypothetical protein